MINQATARLQYSERAMRPQALICALRAYKDVEYILILIGPYHRYIPARERKNHRHFCLTKKAQPTMSEAVQAIGVFGSGVAIIFTAVVLYKEHNRWIERRQRDHKHALQRERLLLKQKAASERQLCINVRTQLAAIDARLETLEGRLDH